ncbi:MAG: hypothetical protein HOJ48_13210 [Desulfobacula sp.]|nr:hypothetical protein [Desulfobacula sp.]
MKTSFQCTNTNCNFPGKGQFEMTFNTESIVDSNNIATVFCPFCKKPMMASELLTSSKESVINIDNIHLPS